MINKPEDFVHKLAEDAYVVAKWHRGFNYWFTQDVHPFGLFLDQFGNKYPIISDLPKNLVPLGAIVHKTKESALDAAAKLYAPYSERAKR